MITHDRRLRSAARNQQAAQDVYRELGDRLGQANTLTELAEVRRLTGSSRPRARRVTAFKEPIDA
jgi:hypothetical protein